MQNPNQEPTAKFSRKAARSSWMLFILAVIITVLSRKIPGAVVPCEIAVLIVLVAGVICGVTGLSGIRRHGTHHILWPSIVGIVLNAMLVFIFATNYVSARGRAAPTASGNRGALFHIGTWDTKTPRGELMSYTFTPDLFYLTVGSGKRISGKYSIDYSKTPMWFTIETRDANGNTRPFPLILEFKDKDTMRMLGPAPGTTARPTGFEGRPDLLDYARRL